MAAFAAGNDLEGPTPMAQVDDDLTGRQLLDVRTPRQFAESHCPGAVNVPVDELRGRLDELDPTLPTVTICHSGKRAHVAARILQQRGFHEVSTLTGGMQVITLSNEARGDAHRTTG
jgi:rhodanese-related sulfurtransferase